MGRISKRTLVVIVCSVVTVVIAILLSAHNNQDVQFMLTRRFLYSDLHPKYEAASLLLGCILRPVLRLLFSPTSDSFYNREYTFDGVAGNVDVHRDRFGVPHIVATNMDDAFFAQGFLHAVERPWQMEVMRLAAKGELASAFGQAAVKSDALARAFGFCRDGDALDDVPTNEDELIAYAKGVTAGLNALPQWPIEFHLIQHYPNTTWTAGDSKCLLKMQAVALSHGWSAEYSTELLHSLQPPTGLLTPVIPDILSELTRKLDFNIPPANGVDKHAAVFDKNTGERLPATSVFGEESDEELLSGVQVPKSEYAIPVVAGYVPDSGTDSNVNGKASFLNDNAPADPMIMGAALGVGGASGSNAWVLSGEHTASGAPLLAADPHLQLTTPSIVMPVYMAVQNEKEGLKRLVGAAGIGLPGVILGRNEHLAWGMTLSYFDKDDLYVLDTGTCPNDPQRNCYLYDDEWYPFKEHEELIYVKGSDAPLPVKVRMSHHGPVISDHFAALMDMVQNNADTGTRGDTGGTDSATTKALAWASVTNRYSAPTTYASDFFKAESPKDIADMFNGPQMRIMSFAATWATTTGDIGITYNGGVFERSGLASRRAHDGTSSAADWKRRLPFAEYPHIQNPPCGFVVQANQIPARDTEDTFGDVYVPGIRAKRIQQLLEGYKSRRNADREAFHAMQRDRLSLLADAFRCEVLRHTLPPATSAQLIQQRVMPDVHTPQQYSLAVPTLYAPVHPSDAGLVPDDCIAVNPQIMINEITKYMSLLLTWDCVMDPQSGMPTLYQTWLQVTGELLLKNITAEVRTAFLGRELDSLFVNRMEFDNHLAVKVIDFLSTESTYLREVVGLTPAALICSALHETLRMLAARYDIPLADLAKEFAAAHHSALVWGDVQNFFAPHAMHDELPPLRQTLSIGPVRNMGGDFSTIYSVHWPVQPMLNTTATGTDIDTTKIRQALKFAQTPSIPVYKMVVDLGNATNSEWSLFGGVSGWAGSEHYSDFAHSWLSDETVQMPWDLDAVIQNAVTTTKILPSKSE